MEENPWDTFESVFKQGSTHKCTVISKNDKGATLELPYGLEGLATHKHLKKEDGSEVEVGETIDFVVVEFSKDDKRIVLSHTNTHTKPAPSEKPAKASKPAKAKAANKSNNEDVSTLGDLDALSALKAEMEDNTKKANAAKKAAEVKKEKAAPKAKKEASAEEAPATDEASSEEEK